MYPREQLDNPQEIMARAQGGASNTGASPARRAPRERGPLSSMRHAVGGSMIVGLTSATVLLWFLCRPPGQPTSRYLGEIVGTSAILLFSYSLVLATKAPFLERSFGGLDRMFLWHRWVAVAGVALLVPHYLLVTSVPPTIRNSLGNALGYVALVGLALLLLWALLPRLPVLGRRVRTTYQRWFTLHRFTGLFVIAGLIHGVLVDPVLGHSTILWAWYVAVATTGTVAYLYRELLHPLVRRRWRHDYIVEAVNRLSGTMCEVVLAPLAQPVPFVAGQFVFVRFGGIAGWERHPFTISSAPQEHLLRLSIKALGDHTQHLIDTLQPGAPARVGLAFGLFDYRRGGRTQVWIAGGIGIAPFRSWVRAFPTGEPLEFDIDFFYTVHDEDEAVFLDDIGTAAGRHATFRPHVTYSGRDGPLTIEQIAAVCHGSLAERTVYMCGPSRLIEGFQRALRTRGVPATHIHFEHFDLR